MKSAFIILLLFTCTTCFAQTGDAMNAAYKKSKLYAVAIHRGDSLFALNCCYGMNFRSAVNSYTFALTQLPDEQYPKDRICEAELYIPYNGIPRYVSDTIAFLKKKSKLDIERGDSAFSRKEFGRAEWYYGEYAVKYYSDLSHETKMFDYCTVKIRYCDSTMHNDALNNFETHYTDSIFTSKDYFEAVVLYEQQLYYIGGVYQYIVDTAKYTAEKSYLKMQIDLCNEHTSYEGFEGALRNEICDGMSGNCWYIAKAGADKGELLKDYVRAKEFYDWMGDDYDSSRMDELIKASGK